MKHFKLTTIIFILFSFYANAQGVWSTKTSMPASPRAFSYVFSIGDTGYVCGGLNLGNLQTDFWAYIPSTDSWIQKSTPAFQSRQGVTFVLNNKAYLCTGMKATGSNANAEVWEYDPSNDTWTQKGNFSGSARLSAYGFVIGNKGYLGGGSTGMSGGQLYDLWEYNPSNDTWTQMQGCPATEYIGFGAFSINGMGYLVGGFGTGTAATNPSNEVWQYNPSNNGWTQKNNFPINVGLTTGFSVNGEGYILNGATQLGSSQQKVNSLYKYNSVADSWTLQAAFPGAVRSSTHALIINNIVYAGHGLGLSSTYYNDWFQYTPATASISTNEVKASIAVYPNPASDKIIISGDDKFYSGMLSDLSGKVVLQFSEINEINTLNIPDGIYIVKVNDYLQRVIIRHN